MISQGDAYIDDLDVDTIRDNRATGVASPNRTLDPKANLKLWNEMKEGTEKGKGMCMRAKIDMKQVNMCLRDPVFYRSVAVPHARTGSKYKVYPMYDFACPIVDSLEGVTHALRSSEYHDRNPLYNWVIEKLGIRKPVIEDFSRLNFAYTLLSKRKLQWIINNGYAEGWDDPRFPTIRGVMRRGMTVQALTEFVVSLGGGKNLNLMEPEKLWALNKKAIDPKVPRYTAVVKSGIVEFHLSNGPKTEEFKTVPRHKKEPLLGNKVLSYKNVVYLEGTDAELIRDGEEVTLMDWGNAIVEKKETKNGKLTLYGRLHLEGDYKTTEKKLTWLSKNDHLVDVNLLLYDNLITKQKVEEDDKIEDIVNKNSKSESMAFGDSNLRLLKKGDAIQLERRGYFICDVPYVSASKAMALINIPDGHSTKQQSVLTGPKKAVEPKESKAEKSSKKVSAKPTSPKPAKKTAEPKGTSPKVAKKAAPKKEEDFDLFAEEDEEEIEKREAEIALIAKKRAEEKKAAGKVIVAKSNVLLDVKVWDTETDLNELVKKIREIKREGLEWKAHQLIDIGYGIKKIQISCNIVDDLVSMDDVQEELENWEDLVQSTDIAAFNKL
jgi:glutamyl/glutaminyl-tRNA synthetase/translation elongation factor EF-1beta